MSEVIRRFKVSGGIFLLFFLFSLTRQASAEALPQGYDLKRGADQFLKDGQIEAAIPLYQRVLEQNPDFANAYYNLATAYYLRGGLEKAAENLEAFLLRRPKDAEALYNLGCLKLRLGAFREAHQYFRRASECPIPRFLGPKIKEALLFVKDLRDQNPETQELLAYLLTT